MVAAQPVKDNPDLIFCRVSLARRAADIFDGLFGPLPPCPGFVFHLHSFSGYDEPEILSCSINPIYPKGVDVRHHEMGHYLCTLILRYDRIVDPTRRRVRAAPAGMP